MRNLQGLRFGRLLVLEPTERRSRGSAVWRCLCDCGAETEASAKHLGKAKNSCGCLGRELSAARRKAAAVPFEDRLLLMPSGCMEWQAHRDRKGYGILRRDNTDLRAHRVAYEMAHGPIPEGAMVLHRCDNPPCCNPDHLYAGSHGDNMVDRGAKGRQAKGEASGTAKLTVEDVKEIRAARGIVSQYRLAAAFGVTQATISKIQLGRWWKHVT